MFVKEKIKQLLAEITYSLYKNKILKNQIRVQSMDETIEELINSKKSLVRFGDGEIVVLKGQNIDSQGTSEEIVEGLKRILSYKHDDLLVAIHEGVESIENFQDSSQKFWKDHLFFCRKYYHKYCNKEKVYANACFSRFYYIYRDKIACEGWISKIKKIWKDQDIVIVEGAGSHNGVENDLFDTAKSIERILCPPKNAFASLDKILEECKRIPKEKLVLLSVGVTAKFLAEELFLEGYRVIDIGNIDLEYEWYLHREVNKVRYKKYEIVTEEENIEAGYLEYLAQIKRRIEG